MYMHGWSQISLITYTMDYVRDMCIGKTECSVATIVDGGVERSVSMQILK